MEAEMDNSFTKLFNEFNSQIELGISKEIKAFFDGKNNIKSFSMQADNANKILIKIQLCIFSKSHAKELFFEFMRFISYDAINLFFCDNNSEVKTKYWFLTQMNDLNGVKMELEIE